MKKIKLSYSTKWLNCDESKIVEFEDDATEEDILEVLNEWVQKEIFSNFEEVEQEEDQ